MNVAGVMLVDVSFILYNCSYFCAVDTGSDNEQEEEDNGQEEDEGEKLEVDALPQPRPLHITKSVYVKRVTPNVTTADIEQVSCNCSWLRACSHAHTHTHTHTHMHHSFIHNYSISYATLLLHTYDVHM